jgi:hypothetical protein
MKLCSVKLFYICSMARKKWESKAEVTPSLIKFREKRKWQIALRRYVLEKNICFDYAPYFGLDIENMRRWFEYQFNQDLGWDNFAKSWQFDHIIPVTYFDFSNEDELKMCWNFTNISVQKFGLNKERGNRLDVTAAKKYFKELYETTGYHMCQKLLMKIDQIELSDFISTEGQQAFIREHADYLKTVENYTAFEFELINRGRNINDVKNELDFLKKFDSLKTEGDNFATNV